MPHRLDIVELGQAGLGDDLERLAGGVGQEVKMKAAHPRIRPLAPSIAFISPAERFALWKTMGKSLAEGSGPFQGKLSSPHFGIDPQFNEE